MDAEVEKRLDQIDSKLDELYQLQLNNAQQDIRLTNVEESIKELKELKKQTANMWLAPLISSLISALIAYVVSGGLGV